MESTFAPDMGELKDIIPGRIREYRKKAGFKTQQDLADKMGTGRVTVTRWESTAQNITVDTLEKIAEACGVSVFDLVKPKG